MIDKNPNTSLKQIYENVTAINYDVDNLWAEWKKEVAEIKMSTLEKILCVNWIDEFYEVTSKGISPLES